MYDYNHLITYCIMNETIKNYEAPQCEVIEMELQGMIAASGEPAGAPSWGPKTF